MPRPDHRRRADVDGLLGRSSGNSMLYTISLVNVAMMFCGDMERTNQLKAIADRVLAVAKTQGALIVARVMTSIGANMILCDQYMAIVIGPRCDATEPSLGFSAVSARNVTVSGPEC
ncbi:Na+/H+ antiporter NhaC family protein [Roseovarius litorisediminis]|nr:Na+/H+ antiporter NhaC family protein [Roseovarius litorisediminis]